MGESLEHRPLPPVKHRRPDLLPAQVTVKEVAVSRLHVTDRPVRRATGTLESARVSIGKECERVDGLCGRLYVGRHRPIVRVLRSALRLEKDLTKVREP